MRRLWTASALASLAVAVAAVLLWTCPPCDVVRRDRDAGFVYVGTAFGQLVVEVDQRGRVVGEPFGPARGLTWGGVRLVRYDGSARPNRVVACRVPLWLVAALATPLPLAWGVLRWRRRPTTPPVSSASG